MEIIRLQLANFSYPYMLIAVCALTVQEVNLRKESDAIGQRKAGADIYLNNG